MEIQHRFIDNLIPNWEFETLYVGTFNPNIYNEKILANNEIDFFYGRPKNLFWDVMPKIHCSQSLIGATKKTKIEFLKNNRVAVTDIVRAVTFPDTLEEIATEKLVKYKDSDLDYFIKTEGCAIETTSIADILINNGENTARVILTRQNPNNLRFIRDTWRSLPGVFMGNIYTVWSPSCWGLKSKSVNLSREEALFRKWNEVINLK